MKWGDVPEISMQIASALLEAVKQKDAGTFSHCCRVSKYSRLLARSMQLNPFEQKIAEYAGLFHDIGKIGVPDHILKKPDRLTPEEDLIMREHPENSARIVEEFAHIPFFNSLLPGIRYHHERIDGQGYPDELKGEEIPIYARLILIVDTYDAMTNTRPYRKGLTKEHAYKELLKHSGTQFDAHLVKLFIESHPHWKQFDEEAQNDYVTLKLKRAA